MKTILALISAGLACIASATAYGGDSGDSGDTNSSGVRGWTNPRTGVFHPLPSLLGAAPANLLTFSGTVNANVTGTISPALSGTETLSCEIVIVVSGSSTTASYYQQKSDFVPATVSGASFTCPATLNYLAHIDSSITTPELEISVDLEAIATTTGTVPLSRSMSASRPDLEVVLPLPRSGVTTNKTFSGVVF